MSVKVKLGAIFSLIFILFIVGISLFIWKSNNKLLNTSIEDKMNVTVHSVESLLEEKAKQALAVGITVSSIPEVVEAAKDQNREEAIKRMVPIFESLKDEFYISVLHLRSPFDTSLVRAQKIDNYGDKTTRQAIVDTGSANQSHYGFDQGPFGIGMRGWNPITSNGEVIGTMETNIEFTEELLGEIKDALGIDLFIYAPDEEGKMTYLSGTIDMENEVEEQLVVQANDNRSEIVRDGDSAYTLFPIKSYEGETLTIMGAVDDISHYRTIITQETRSLLIYLMILGIVFTFIILLFLHVTLKPLKTISDMAQQVAEGDLSQNVYIKSNDELGKLATIFNVMIDNLRRLIQNTSNSVDSVSSSSQELAAITEQNANNMNQLSDSTQQVHQYTNEQNYNISSTAAIVERMNDELLEISATINTIASSINETSDCAREGNSTMEDARVEMTNINYSALEVSVLLKELEEQSKSIGKIVGIVHSIAQETNLLALNAAIEAARAGESGKGFAVVAQEVRKLAEHSIESTKEIENFTKQIQAGADKAMEAMEKNMLQVEKGTKLITGEAQMFNKINEDVHRVSGRMGIVLSTTDKVSANSATILKNIQSLETISGQIAISAKEMAAMSEEQTASIEEVSASSETLANVANDIQKEIHAFKL